MMRAAFALVLSILLASTQAGAAADDCAAPAPVCDARAAVFAIASFDPLASAVRLGPDLLVTNRHAVADNTDAEVMLPDGARLRADVVPNGYPGDLVLLHAAGLPEGPALQPAPLPAPDAGLYTVGADLARGAIRVYRPGVMTLAPAAGAPLARLHNDAYSQPGNSGGALLDEAGRLVGITASGGEGHNEAIPATELDKLRALSGAEHAEESARLGTAYRLCTEDLEAAHAAAARLDARRAEGIAEVCRATGNHQLMDEAATTLGQGGYLAESRKLFEASLDQDPNAINARLGLVVTLQLARQYADAVPHVAWLLDHLPEDEQVLRFAIQAGKWGGDLALAGRALELLELYHPRTAPAAKRFLESGPPAPQPAQ